MTLKKYITGFVLCILITLFAYHVATGGLVSVQSAVGILAALALLQFVIQLFCFLHLDFRKDSRERLIILCCASGVVCILLSGSMWIMFTLNARQMPSTQQMEQYMNDQVGF